jgi:hypothetical protein
VTEDVGEALLQGLEDGDLGLARDAAELREGVNEDADAATLLEALGQPGDRGAETGLLEQWRVEQIGGAANLGGALVGELLGLLDELVEGGVLVVLDEALEAAEVPVENGQLLGGGVVEVAGEPAALLLLEVLELVGHLQESGAGAVALGDVLVEGIDARELTVDHEGNAMQLDVERGSVFSAPLRDDVNLRSLEDSVAEIGGLVSQFGPGDEVVGVGDEELAVGEMKEFFEGGVAHSVSMVGIEDQDGDGTVFDEGLQVRIGPSWTAPRSSWVEVDVVG